MLQVIFIKAIVEFSNDKFMVHKNEMFNEVRCVQKLQNVTPH